MKPEELIAEKYLLQKYNNLIYEPDGNIPPDFSIYNKIGVEVRRLNQQYRGNGKIEGLDDNGIRLEMAINSELQKYPKSANGNCYLLSLYYGRPIGVLKKVKENLQKAIKAFETNGENTPYEYSIGAHTQITFQFASNDNCFSYKYEIGIISDTDSGGWLISMYIQDITHCIKEKEEKIKPYFTKYKPWLLLLVDYIGFFSNEDAHKIIDNIKKPVCFDKVIVVSSDSKLLFEIYGKNLDQSLNCENKNF